MVRNATHVSYPTACYNFLHKSLLFAVALELTLDTHFCFVSAYNCMSETNSWISVYNYVCLIIKMYVYIGGTAGAQWLRCCATNRKDAGSIPAGVSGFFTYIKSLRSHCGLGVDSASNRNEYQECFLGIKGPERKADNLTTILCRCHEICEL